jgi:hypothetical protein
MLKEKDYRVCSRHFDQDDFSIPLLTLKRWAEEKCNSDSDASRWWLEQDFSAFRVLKGLVLDTNLQRDLKQMALFKHTGMPQ